MNLLLTSILFVAADDRPNILWITCEDMGPHLGCYGDDYATTPNLDKFAKTALRYKKCWSNAPVCAPARTTLISGMYATSLGAEHMRSLAPFPKGLKLFPQYLRDAGYYCTNNSKEDYNVVKPGKVWDESSNKAHWKNRQPGQPFFAVVNFTNTHESQIRKRPHTLVHDPAKFKLPSYYPDVPEVRRDWAQYYDNITTMDGQFAKTLGELEAAGLAENTIVFFFSDHGAGMPRHKRSACNSGLHVPLLVRIPEKYKHLAPKDYTADGITERLVSFVDFGPTVLSLAGVKPLPHFQGKAFMGAHEAEPNKYLFGYRGRMDERYDCVRTVTDGRYVLVANFMPWLPHGQHVEYMFQTPTTRVWKRMFDEGKLNGKQAAYWKPRHEFELYDVESDHEETVNLSYLDQYRDARFKLRCALSDCCEQNFDLGFVPEAIRVLSCGREAPYDFFRRHVERHRSTLRLTGTLFPSLPLPPTDFRLINDADPTDSYWVLKQYGRRHAESAVIALKNASPSVKVAAAEIVLQYGSPDQQKQALAVLLELAPVKKNGVYVAGEALNALSNRGELARPGLEVIRNAAEGIEEVEPRVRIMPERLVEQIVRDLERKQ